MAHSASAIKRHRQSLRRRERNKTRITAARSSVREARELIAAGSPEEAAEAVRSASSILDRTARRGVLHPNNAARRKSRLARQLNALQGGATTAAPKQRTAARASGGRAKTATRKTPSRGKKS